MTVIAPTLARLAVALLVIGSALRAAAAPATGADLVGGRKAWDSYFPFRLGDSWTYDWRSDGPLAASTAAVRTRTFDGTSFLNDSVGYKLVSDDGAYHLYTFVHGTLAIHSSSEAGRLLYYDPPVVLAAPGMIVGRPVTVAHPDTGRTWHTTLNGMEDVSTPLGKFERCLVITLEMQGPDFSSRATHYFAPRAGLVAYKYHLRDSHDGRALLDIDAVLKLARLAGTNIASLSDLDAIRDASLPAGEDRDVRELLRRALMKRYTWDAQFPGFRGSWELAEAGRAPVAGEFVVAADLTVTVEAPDDAARATMRNEISSFITQRKEVPFDTAYAETTFARSATRPDGTVVVIAANDPLATTYTIKGDELVEVSRSVGRLSYTARDRQKMSTEDGRTLTVDYDVVYTSNQNHAQVAVEHMQDTYAKLGSYWVPTGRKIERTEAGRPPTRREIALTALRSGS